MFHVSPYYSDSLARALRYADLRGDVSYSGILGSGQDGLVLATSRGTAVKAARYEDLYTRELKVYKRFQEKGVGKIGRFSVPELVDHEETLWVIEMQIVSPPFVLDFAGASVDRKPDFSEEILETA